MHRPGDQWIITDQYERNKVDFNKMGKMIQQDFAEKVKKILAIDDSVIGLAVGGSWITNEIDEFSDIDLVLVTKQKVTNDKTKMLDHAKKFGDLLSGFTGEHVGEPRLLICLYDNPLLHVDIKFVTLEEFKIRVETPVILLDKNDQLKKALAESTATFPTPDFQWLEDRFWVWVHYGALKIMRGEYFEAYDFFGALRMMVLGPLLHMKNGQLPRSVRKAETSFTKDDLDDLKLTLPNYNKQSLTECLKNSVALYRKIRTQLYDDRVILQTKAEARVMKYLEEIS